jgi:hypothetical protein
VQPLHDSSFRTSEGLYRRDVGSGFYGCLLCDRQFFRSEDAPGILDCDVRDLIDAAFDVGWAWSMNPADIMEMSLEDVFMYAAQYVRLRKRENRNG